MSFVAGFVTGLSTAGAVERRKGRSQLREYMELRGYSVIDRTGQPVPLDTVVDEGLALGNHSRRTMLVTGAIVISAVVLTGGSAWVILSIV